MSTLTILEFFVGIGLTMIGVYTLVHEKKLIKFEKKVAKYVKAFFKAIVITLNEKKQPQVKQEVKTQGNAEYEEMLQRLNSKVTPIEEYLVA